MIIDVKDSFNFFEDNLTINEVKDLYYSVIPREKEDTILKMFDLIDKYMIYYDYKDSTEMVNEYQNSIIGLLYNRYDFSLEKIEIEDKLLEELINTYVNLRYSLYNKIVNFAFMARDSERIDRKEYTFVLYALSSFNLESIFYNYIIKKNVHSVKYEIKLMNLVIDYLYKMDIKDEEVDSLDQEYDFNYTKPSMINMIKDDNEEKKLILRKGK